MTLKDYILRWQEVYDKNQSRPTTYAAHGYIFKNHIAETSVTPWFQRSITLSFKYFRSALAKVILVAGANWETQRGMLFSIAEYEPEPSGKPDSDRVSPLCRRWKCQ